MRLPIVCPQCMKDDVGSAHPFTTMEWQDEGRYEIACPKGHTAVTILQEQKFELLFDIGAYALIDGYYREAVSSFTSSLERFYEFFITAAFLEKGIDAALFSKTWKLISNQSERQLGAFILVYLAELHKTPMLLSQKSIEFRNAVVHKGTIPSRERAIEYGQEILDQVRPAFRQAKERCPKGVRAAIFQHMMQSRRTPGEVSGTMTTPTIISLSRDDKSYNERTLDDALKELRRWT